MRFMGNNLVGIALAGLFAAIPTSTNYSMPGYDLGGGGAGTSTSSSYGLTGTAGSQAGGSASSATYATQTGLEGVRNTGVPAAPTFTNPSSYYDRLKLVLATPSNPTDTKFAIAISSDNFVTTQYVKSDHSIGSTLVIGDYQTYTTWGGASGFLVLGLQGSTTYKVKVKALQGGYTGSAYGPTATASTVAASISFAVATSLTGTPPFTAAFASLTAGSVVNAGATAILTFSTNALNGGSIYVRDTNAGLNSSAATYTLTSATADLSVASKGYGGIVTAVSQTTGGPITASAPYNGTVNAVGAFAAGMQELGASAGPITGGSMTVTLKAKADVTVPSASDYSDALTFVAAAGF